jgi:hypothetical protein
LPPPIMEIDIKIRGKKTNQTRTLSDKCIAGVCVCVWTSILFYFFIFFYLERMVTRLCCYSDYGLPVFVFVWFTEYLFPPPFLLFLFGVCVPFHSIPDITQTQREMRSGSQLRPKDWRTQMGVRRSIVSLPQTVSSCPIPPCPLCMESNAHERLVPLVNGEFCHVPYPTPILFRPFVRALFSLSCFYF